MWLYIRKLWAVTKIMVYIYIYIYTKLYIHVINIYIELRPDFTLHTNEVGFWRINKDNAKHNSISA